MSPSTYSPFPGAGTSSHDVEENALEQGVERGAFRKAGHNRYAPAD